MFSIIFIDIQPLQLLQHSNHPSDSFGILVGLDLHSTAFAQIATHLVWPCHRTFLHVWYQFHQNLTAPSLTATCSSLWLELTSQPTSTPIQPLRLQSLP